MLGERVIVFNDTVTLLGHMCHSLIGNERKCEGEYCTCYEHNGLAHVLSVGIEVGEVYQAGEMKNMISGYSRMK